MSDNVAALLRERAGLHPDRDAIVQYRRGRSRRVSFSGLEEAVLRLAGSLRARGIGPGDRVLVFVPMSIELYVTLLACFHRGAAAVFLDAWADRERLDAAVSLAAPAAVIAASRAYLLRLVSPVLRRVPLWLSPAAGAEERAARPEPEPVTPDTPALITLTTGTTGRPKGAVRTHSLLWAQHRALAASLRPEEGDVDMPTLPMFVLNNLALGIPSVIPEFDPRRPAEIRPAAVYRQLLAEGVTTSSGSPALFERLGEWCVQRGFRLPLRALFTGGAPVLPPLARLLTDVVEGEAHAVYGSTEAEPISAISLREMLHQIATCSSPLGGLPAGRPVAGLEMRLVQPHLGPVSLGAGGWAAWESPPGDPGEIVVSGEHVLQRYLGDEEAGRQSKIRDGAHLWHRTGDVARLDARGLWLLGRMTEAVRRPDGVWWSLPVELQALRTPGVRSAAYLSHDERAVLCIEAAMRDLSAEEREALAASLRPAPVDEVRLFAKLPRDRRHQSRIDRERLRTMVR